MAACVLDQAGEVVWRNKEYNITYV